MKRSIKALAAIVLPLIPVSTFGSCLSEVSEFANSICGEIENSGKHDLIDVNGNLDLEVSGIVRKIVGGKAGVEGRKLVDVYEGVLRKDLAQEKFNARDCKIKMVEVARQEACTQMPVYAKCRHPDFGRVGWQKSEDITDSTGRLGGGHDQPWWCNQVITGYVTSRGLGSNYEASVLRSWEESDKDWAGHVTYKYHCQVRIQSVPLYAERQDPRCGVVR